MTRSGYVSLVRLMAAASLVFCGAARSHAADFTDTQIGQWRVYRTAVRGANACQIAPNNIEPGRPLPTWTFNVALYDNSTGPLIDLQGLYSGDDASLYSKTPKKVAAIATIDGQQFVGDGEIQGENITSYDSTYQGAAAATLAARLKQLIHQMTLTVGGQTVNAPTQDLDKAFALAETCYPLWLGHPLVWQTAQAQPASQTQPASPAPGAPTVQFVSVDDLLQQGYTIANVALLPAAEVRAAFNTATLGALAMVTLQHGTAIAVCTVSIQDWVYTNPQALAGKWCRRP